MAKFRTRTSGSVGRGRAVRKRVVLLPKAEKSWLLAGTALATGMFAALLVSPKTALAAGECGDAVSGEVTCSDTAPPAPVGFDGPYNDGVQYITGSNGVSGNLTINVLGATIADAGTTDAAAFDIFLSDGGSFTLNVNGVTTNTYTGTDTNALWIEVVGDGAITINGIGGTATSTGMTNTFAGGGNNGIQLTSDNGPVNLTLNDSDVVIGGTNGVRIDTTGGNINAVNHGEVFSNGDGEYYGIRAESTGVVAGGNQVVVNNLGLTQTRGDADAAIFAQAASEDEGFAGVYNGGALIADPMLDLNARINAYDFVDLGNGTFTQTVFDANGIEVRKFGGDGGMVFNIPENFVEYLSGLINYDLSNIDIGGGNVVDLGLVGFEFSTFSANYGTWDFESDENYLTPGFDEFGNPLGEGAMAAATTGGVFAPGGSAWLARNFSNGNTGLWNYGTMIGQGSEGDPVLDINTSVGYADLFYNYDPDTNPDPVFDNDLLPFTFTYIYNAGYMTGDPAYNPEYDIYDENTVYGNGTGQASYGVIGSEATPYNWQFSAQHAFETKFGYYADGGVDWDFIKNSLLGNGELARFADASNDQLITTDGPEGGGNTLIMFNQGLLIGQMDIDSQSGYPNFILNDGTWFTRGTSNFFGDGLFGIGDVLLNTGLVQASFVSELSSTTTFRSLNNTINAGVVSLLDGGFEYDDDDTGDPEINGILYDVDGDRIRFDGDYYGGLGLISELGDLIGGEEGEGEEDYEQTVGYFALDAFLAGGENEDLGEADFFDIWGDLSGHTKLIIRTDPLSNDYAGVNQQGIDVVEYNSLNGSILGEEAGDCTDNPENICTDDDAVSISEFSPNFEKYGDIPVIEQGLYAWYLVHDEQYQDFELRSTFGANAANAAGIATGAQNIWYETYSVVDDHSYAHQFANSGGGGADLITEAPVYDTVPVVTTTGTRTGLWAKASGSWIERDTDLDLDMLGEVESSTDQQIFSVLGGADMKPWGADSPVRIGLFGGYVTSDLDFDVGSSSVDYEGGVIGAYAAYNNGAWYVDATVKGDLLNADYSFDGTDVDADVTSVGVAANTGYRFGFGGGFVEPIASIAYVNTDVDDFDGGGGSVSFSENDSLRAGAGARIGTTSVTGGGTTELSLLGKVWNEFEDANTVTVTDGINTASFSDDIEGVFGEVEATALMTSSDGTLSGFVSAGGKFGEDFTSWNAKAGVRKGF